MSRTATKRAVPVDEYRRFLEPGPVVLVSSAWRGRRTIMTMGWHMVMDSPLVAGYVWDQNFSHALIRGSRECVINVPGVALAEEVVRIGNTSGRDVDKFTAFGLTPVRGRRVSAPMIAECHASFECRLVDTSLIKRYSLFVFEVVAAHAARRPRWPTTMHYRGDGEFMIAGKTVRTWRRRFRPEMLE